MLLINVSAPSPPPPVEYLPTPVAIPHHVPAGKPIYGDAVLQDLVFNVCKGTPEVEVFNAEALKLVRRIPVRALIQPRDMAASAALGMLFVAGQKWYEIDKAIVYRIHRLTIK